MNINSTLFKIPIVKNVVYFEETDSTNIRAKEFGRKDCVDGTLVIANSQTSGKGRLGRNYSSPAGDGIYMSLLLRPGFPIERFSQLNIITAIAVSRALNAISETSTSIKWPNDVLINNKKVAGILSESELGSDTPFVIIGIGINVNNSFFTDELISVATSLAMENNIRFVREELIYNILMEFSHLYDTFSSNNDLSWIKDEYNESLICYNKDIYIIPQDVSNNSPNSYMASTTGLPIKHCIGIDNIGNLLCKDHDEQLLYLNSGEVSIRGLNGYIA